MVYCIDRFEGNYAICENEYGHFIDILRSRLPKEAKETDCFVITREEDIIMDEMETEKRKDIVMDLQSKLFKKQ